MISNKDVERIAKLARIGLTQKEIRKFQRELSTILDYVEKLKEVDILGVAPTSHPLEIENVMRGDIVKSNMNKFLASKNKEQKAHCSHTAKRLLDLAPEIKNGYLKVKSIL